MVCLTPAGAESSFVIAAANRVHVVRVEALSGLCSSPKFIKTLSKVLFLVRFKRPNPSIVQTYLG